MNEGKMIYGNALFGFRNDTLKSWQEKNPVLLSGEPGVVTGKEKIGDGQCLESERIKFGDGITPWNDLPWWKGPQGDKGDKGDTGAIKFIPVTTLPTKNIDTNAVYLVPITNWVGSSGSWFTGAKTITSKGFSEMASKVEYCRIVIANSDLNSTIKPSDLPDGALTFVTTAGELVTPVMAQGTLDKGAIYNNVTTRIYTKDLFLIADYTEVRLAEGYSMYVHLYSRDSFKEYMYINGTWEFIGTANVEVNLDEYVKKTDFASSDTAGVVKVHGNGLNITDGGILSISPAREWEFYPGEREYSNSPITPPLLTKAIKVGLTTNTETLTDEEKTAACGWLGAATNIDSIPDCWKTALEEGAQAINEKLCIAGSNKSAFLFYSDSHYNYGSQMSPKLLKYLYKHTGITKTNFGGDIVNNEGVDYDTMEYLWEWRNQLKDLPNHHSVVGNHDDGNYTNDLFSEQYIYGYLLAAEETPDIVRGDNGMYYYIDNSPEKTRYLYLDTAYKGMTTEQQEFIKQALLTTPDNWHIVVIAHIWYDTIYPDTETGIAEYGVGEISADAKIVTALLDAYNSRTGDFADCGGKVEFCIGGHTHTDYDGTTETGIPIILVETDSKHVRSGLSYNTNTTSEASVNGVIADYTNRKIYVVRIGRGESRDVEITNYVVSYTNILPLATTNDGATIYNAEDTAGYKADTRWSSSSKAESTSTGIYLTGYIPINEGDVIRLKNITMPNEASNYCVLHMFRTLDDTNEGNINNTNIESYYSPEWDDNGNLTQFTIPSASEYKYVRIQCGGIDDTSIITINESIE